MEVYNIFNFRNIEIYERVNYNLFLCCLFKLLKKYIFRLFKKLRVLLKVKKRGLINRDF